MEVIFCYFLHYLNNFFTHPSKLKKQPSSMEKFVSTAIHHYDGSRATEIALVFAKSAKDLILGETNGLVEGRSNLSDISKKLL
jgi:hypothetical protein